MTFLPKGLTDIVFNVRTNMLANAFCPPLMGRGAAFLSSYRVKPVNGTVNLDFLDIPCPYIRIYGVPPTISWQQTL
jgi:hypothetical protein